MARESRISSRRCLLKQRYSYAVYNYTGKAGLGKGYWNAKRKLGVTTHFSEIIKLHDQFDFFFFFRIFALFRMIVA